MRIRDLIMVAIYVAVATAFTIDLRRGWARADFAGSITRFAVVPAVLAGLSVVSLRPGPRRDWISAFLISLAFIPCGMFMSLPLLVLCWPALVSLPTPSVRSAIVISGFGLLIWGVFLRFIRGRLTARGCPGCGRRTLVGAAFQGEKTRNKEWYYRCRDCRRVFRFNERARPVSSVGESMKTVPARAACPGCGSRYVGRIGYKFFWCLACRSRYKREGKGAWEDAGQADDDRFYWLWSPMDWLTRLRARRTGCRGRSDPPP